MPGRKTSVLLVTAANKENTHFHIPSSVVKNWKKITAAFVAIIVLLTGIIAWLVYFKTGHYYEAQLAKSDQRLRTVTKMVDVRMLEKSFQAIDSSLLQINEYLQEKGLGTAKPLNVGGEGGFEIQDVNSVASFYDSYLKNIAQQLRFTPLGRPSDGEQTSHFGYRSNPFSGNGTESHFGIDFKGNIGDPIKTTADGTIHFAGTKGGYGNCIIVKHANGYETLYGHLSKIMVLEGQAVKAGSMIGLMGSTGRSTGPHLHYEVMLNGVKINPEKFFQF